MGEPVDRMADDLAKAMSASVSNAMRVVRTEGANLATKAALVLYDRLGV
jgi:hypothetical protein